MLQPFKGREKMPTQFVLASITIQIITIFSISFPPCPGKTVQDKKGHEVQAILEIS